MWKRCRSTAKRYPGDNRLILPKSPYRRQSLAPRCRLVASWGWSRSQGLGCSPIKAVRELGLERRTLRLHGAIRGCPPAHIGETLSVVSEPYTQGNTEGRPHDEGRGGVLPSGFPGRRWEHPLPACQAAGLSLLWLLPQLDSLRDAQEFLRVAREVDAFATLNCSKTKRISAVDVELHLRGKGVLAPVTTSSAVLDRGDGVPAADASPRQIYGPHNTPAPRNRVKV
jgi:hypothetical protein